MNNAETASKALNNEYGLGRHASSLVSRDGSVFDPLCSIYAVAM